MTGAIEGATLNEAVAGPAVAVASAAADLRRNPAARQRARSAFYMGMSGTLLLIVLVGFMPTLYLRPIFGAPDIPAYLSVHGAVLTAWFVGFFLQTGLVAGHRTDIHRRLGFAGAGLGVAVLALNAIVTLSFVPRLRGAGVDVEAGMAGLSAIVWQNLAALLCFTIFLSMAIALRRRPEMHKRLMLLASISIVQPAMARIRRWPVFDGVDPVLFTMVGLALLLLALALYDVISRKRVHPVTLIGGSFFLGSRLFSGLVIASSEVGRSFVHWLQ